METRIGTKIIETGGGKEARRTETKGGKRSIEIIIAEIAIKNVKCH